MNNTKNEDQKIKTPPSQLKPQPKTQPKPNANTKTNVKANVEVKPTPRTGGASQPSQQSQPNGPPGPENRYGYDYGYSQVHAPPQAAQFPQVHHHYYYEAPKPIKSRSSKPTIAGALLVLTAVLGLLGSVMMIGAGVMFSTADTEGFDFFGMPNEGDVFGRVTYQNGTGVEGATVTIVDQDLTTFTDNDGYYHLYDVPSGNQELRIEKDGYNSFVKKIFVSPRDSNMDPNNNNDGQSNEHNFRLTTGSDTIERGEYPPWGLISGFVIGCAVLVIVFSIISLLSGYFAIKRKKFGLAIAGAILGIFTLIGTLFSLIALFILIISRKEFRRE